jgi:hypothetical protein
MLNQGHCITTYKNASNPATIAPRLTPALVNWKDAAPVLTAKDADAVLEPLVAEAVPFPTVIVTEPDGAAEPDGVIDIEPEGVADPDWHEGAVLTWMFWSLQREAASWVVAVGDISNRMCQCVSDDNQPAISA